VICIDGIFLTGRYKCQILTAIAVDCNKQIIPVAFAFVENENSESWYWFLERVKVHVVATRPDVCLISDRHTCLLQSILKLQGGTATTPPLWPDVQNRWCIRHMGANFYDHFKNKDLMNMFKRLCIQNQQRKFNALWQMLDQLTAEHVKARAAGTSSSLSAEARASIEKPFSHWIRDAPKQKWSFLYDTNGMRYGIETTNHAKCFNMVMRCCRAFPLVGIVEFIIYGCMKYFRERYMADTVNMNNPNIQFCRRVTQYMQEKIAKAKQHRVISTGTMEHRFEVQCKDRTGRGIRRDMVVQEALIRAYGTAFCSCMKPKLLHLPCSHVLAACAESGLQPEIFVSPYFSKEAAVSTLGHEIYGIGIVGSFIEDN
jgi:hypothetical protein